MEVAEKKSDYKIENISVPMSMFVHRLYDCLPKNKISKTNGERLSK